MKQMHRKKKKANNHVSFVSGFSSLPPSPNTGQFTSFLTYHTRTNCMCCSQCRCRGKTRRKLRKGVQKQRLADTQKMEKKKKKKKKKLTSPSFQKFLGPFVDGWKELWCDLLTKKPWNQSEVVADAVFYVVLESYVRSVLVKNLVSFCRGEQAGRTNKVHLPSNILALDDLRRLDNWTSHSGGQADQGRKQSQDKMEVGTRHVDSKGFFFPSLC